MDQQARAHAAEWFSRNFLDLKKEAVPALIGGVQLEKEKDYETQRKAYSAFRTEREEDGGMRGKIPFVQEFS